jgi:hypothetical protein
MTKLTVAFRNFANAPKKNTGVKQKRKEWTKLCALTAHRQLEHAAKCLCVCVQVYYISKQLTITALLSYSNYFSLPNHYKPDSQVSQTHDFK